MKYLILLLSVISFAQTQTLKGVVLDSVTKQPIPYVNLSVIDATKGTSSLEDGSYTLEIASKDFNKNISISSLAYKPKTIALKTALKLNTIYLQPITEQLDEVIVSQKFENKFLEVKSFDNKDLYGGFGMGKKPWQIGLYFPYDTTYQDTKYLKEVKVYLNKGLGHKKKASKFRIRLLTISSDSLPEYDLLVKNVIAHASKKQKMVSVDLSEFDIEIPNNGFFVILEGLAIPYNAYETTYTMVDANGKKRKIKNEIVYSPAFRAFLSKPDKYIVVHYSNGKWWKHPITFPEKNKKFIPAISLTLSN